MVAREAPFYGGSETVPVGLRESVAYYDLLQNLDFRGRRSFARPVLGAVGYQRPIKSVSKSQYNRPQLQVRRYYSNSPVPSFAGAWGRHRGTGPSVERCTVGPVEWHCSTVTPTPSIDKPVT
jgi:hypothetical protein